MLVDVANNDIGEVNKLFNQQQGNKDVSPGFRLIHRDKRVIFDLEFGLVYFFSDTQCSEPNIISLGSRETELLKFLVEKQGVIVSKDEIIEVIWEGRVVCDNTAAVALSNIRKIIRKFDGKCSCLITVSKKGYLFYPHRSGLYLEVNNEVGTYVQP